LRNTIHLESLLITSYIPSRPFIPAQWYFGGGISVWQEPQ
jgi:hypothetical protein